MPHSARDFRFDPTRSLASARCRLPGRMMCAFRVRLILDEYVARAALASI
jgi:hypothetical protein